MCARGRWERGRGALLSPRAHRNGRDKVHVARMWFVFSLRFVTVDTFSTGGAPSRVIWALLASASCRGSHCWSLFVRMAFVNFLHSVQSRSCVP